MTTRSSVSITKKQLRNFNLSFESWFWLNVDSSAGIDGCWFFGGNKEPAYSSLTRDGKSVLAHRVAYELATGSIDPDLFVCHACDNPPCCNPNHLWLGTHQQNMDDMHQKKRFRGGKRPAIADNELPIIIDLLKDGLTLTRIAKDLHCTPQAIYRAFDRSDTHERPDVPKVQRGGRKPTVTAAQASEAKDMIENRGFTQETAAEALGVSRPALYRALKRNKGEDVEFNIKARKKGQ